MHPSKVHRPTVRELTDLPNVGPSIAGDLRLLGILQPAQLRGQDAFALYERLCAKTGVRHDPCVIDAFLSITHFMAGGKPKPWWEFTAQRKRLVGQGAPVARSRAKRSRRSK